MTDCEVTLRAAHHGVDAGDQLVAVERLGDVIVGAEAEAADLRIHLGDARQDQHRRLHLGDAQLLEHVVAVHVGQVEVEQDDVVIIQLAEVQALLAEIGRVDVEAFGREHELDRLGGGRLVLDQQHAHRKCPPYRSLGNPPLTGVDPGINHGGSQRKRLILCVKGSTAQTVVFWATQVKFPSRPLRSFFCRRRWTEEPMPIASRYLATVRRARSKPLSRSSSTSLSSLTGCRPASSASHSVRICALTASAETAPSPSARRRRRW